MVKYIYQGHTIPKCQKWPQIYVFFTPNALKKVSNDGNKAVIMKHSLYARHYAVHIHISITPLDNLET